MSLYLVAPGLEISIELSISEQVEKALVVQWERLKDPSVREDFCRRMTQQLDTVIPEAIDRDIKPPTQAQISYALILSKQLDVAIPPDALRYRGSMYEFLDTHARIAKEQRANRAG